jgi:isocitrate/isopropylmalate dehydrogenase
LKKEIAEGVDIMVVRELTGGIVTYDNKTWTVVPISLLFMYLQVHCDET